jgi:hypothetical protein
MLKIELDEKSVFTYDPKNMSIGIWDHKDGKYDGPVIGQIGFIKFCDKDQVYHFMEMLEFMLDRLKEDQNVSS